MRTGVPFGLNRVMRKFWPGTNPTDGNITVYPVISCARTGACRKQMALSANAASLAIKTCRAMERFIKSPYLVIPRPQEAWVVVVSCIDNLTEGLRNGSEAVHRRGVRKVTEALAPAQPRKTLR